MDPFKDLDATIGRHVPRARRRSAWLGVAGAALSVVSLVAFYALVDLGTTGSPRFLVMAAIGTGMMLALLSSLVWLGTSAFEARRFGRLESGDGVLARWTLTPDQLRRRVGQRRRLDAEPGALQTTPMLSVLDSNEDVAVIVCQDAVYIGDLFWQPMDGEPGSVVGRLDNDWLELEWLTQDNSDGYILRVPIAPGAEIDAVRAINTFAYRARSASR